MITEGEAAIPLETTRCAFLNQEKSKQRSAIAEFASACCPDFPLLLNIKWELKWEFKVGILDK